MPRVIGIRREDKNRWERRAPLVPEHVQELTRRGVNVAVERSPSASFRTTIIARREPRSSTICRAARSSSA